jgi:hypothetical protein
MTTVNVVVSWATSLTVDLGDVDAEEAFTDDFDWQAFDEAVVSYLDSLSEEELRELYREPEAISHDDPIFDCDPTEADVRMNPDSRAYIQFGAGTTQSYKDLVRQTLETSTYVETEYVGDQLVVTEPEEGRE